MAAGALPTIFVLFLMSGINIGQSSLNEVRQDKLVKLRSDVFSNETKTAIAIAGDSIALECLFVTREDEWSNIQWVKYAREDVEETKVLQVLPRSAASTNGSISSVALTKLRSTQDGRYSCILTTLTGAPKSYKFHVAVKDEPSCRNNICSSNGRCTEAEYGYNCVCNKGFVGTNCEVLDICLNSSPCLNNGTCSTNGDGFTCNCQAGFNGTVCEREDCTPGICGSGASCRVINGKRKCFCPYNKAGERCQYMCNFNNDGYYCSYTTCVISVRNGRTEERCRCDNNRRWGSNRICMMASDLRNECVDLSICNGRGTCNDQIYGYRCNCNSYASGRNCETYNECRAGNHLCSVNGGNCVDLTVGYKCTHCPEGQTGDKCQFKENPCTITCQPTSMLVECDMRFLNVKLRSIPIYLNTKTSSCRFQGARSHRYHGLYGYDRRRMLMWRKTVAYTACGTETEFVDDYVIYRNTLSGGVSRRTRDVSDGIITRNVGHYSFDMECKLPLIGNTTKQLTDYSLLLNESMDLAQNKDVGISGTYFEIYSTNYHSQTSSYVVGDRLYVKMGLNTDNNPTLLNGYRLHPITCYATSDSNDDSEDQRYVLIEDGCILDETLRYEKRIPDSANLRDAYFSFDSFTFKSNPGKLYLHCTSRLCVDQKPVSSGSEKCDVTCKRKDEHVTTAQPHSTNLHSAANVTIIDRTPGSASVEIFTSKPNVEA